MDFSDNRLSSSVDVLRAAASSEGERAIGDNYAFEELVSTARRSRFENFARVDVPYLSLEKAHTEYFNVHCKNDDEEPDTFAVDLHPATIGDIADEQRLVRLEDIGWMLGGHWSNWQILEEARATGNGALLEDFFANWNPRKFKSPQFAAIFDEVEVHLQHNDWAERLRNALGLAHLNPSAKRISVALMSYSVRDVMRASPDGQPFLTMPTVLDSTPWQYYFPAPRGCCYGRALTLGVDHDESGLHCEVLHRAFAYRAGHIVRFGEISLPIGANSIRDLRNHHLLCLRLATGNAEFGSEMI